MRIFLYLILLSGVVLLGFTACKDEDKAYELLLSKTSVSVEEGGSVIVYIEKGNGGYEASSSLKDVATVEVSGNSIIISGLTQGTTTVTVRDGAGKSCPIEVTVISYVQGSNTPRFKWDDYIELEQVNNWNITIGTNRIGVTNVFEKKQYIVTWRGDLSAGTKSEATLKIVENGKETRIVSLTKLTIINEEDGFCFIAFQNDSQRGELVFTK